MLKISSCLVATAVFLCCPQLATPQVFRADVNLVLVDMRVLGDGSLVTDLRSDELTLLIDGEPRPIVSLTYQPSLVAGSGDGAPSLQASSENRAAIARVVIVVDSASIPPGDGAKVLRSAQGFVQQLPSSFAVAVATLPLRELHFETSREASRRALADALRQTSAVGAGGEGTAGFGCTGAAAAAGCGDQGLPLPAGALEKMRATNNAAESHLRGNAALHDLQRLFGAIGQAPADVVLVTGGLPRLESLRPEIEKTVEVAHRARVRVHALTIANSTEAMLPQNGPTVTIPDPPPVALGPTYGLPEQTGGVEQIGAASGSTFFSQLGQELAGSYLLAFEPLPRERDGQTHSIEILTARRPRPAIRARKVFVIDSTLGPTKTAPVESVVSSPHVTPGTGGGATSSANAESVLRTVISRASAYVERFQRACSVVVAEERYIQVLKVWTGHAPIPGDEPELEYRSGEGQVEGRPGGAVQRRQLVSDMLLVQAPGQVWIGYRDVAEVDGKPVRDRVARVQQLFLSGKPDDRRQLERIATESARFNLGTDRTLNLPTFPLQTLLGKSVSRFAWTRYADEPSESNCCVVLGLKEIKSPTLVRTWEDHDVPLTGRLWIEPDTGRVVRAALQFGTPIDQVQGAVDVTYGGTPGVDVLVPIRMWEWVRGQDQNHLGRPAYLEGQARYSNIRRFTVNTDETVRSSP